MEGILSVLGKVGFDWQVALANLVNFLVIFLLLWKLAFKPIGKVIDERNAKITKGLNDAEEYSRLIKEVEVKYEEVLAKARVEADSLIKNAKKEAVTQKAKVLEDAREEVSSMIEAGKKSLEIEKNKMVSEAKKDLVNLVMKSTESVLMGKVDDVLSDRIIKNLNQVK